MRSKRPGWAAAGRRSSLISALSGRRRFPVDFDELDETLDAEVDERLRRDGGDAREDVGQPGLRIEPFILAVYAAQRTMPKGAEDDQLLRRAGTVLHDAGPRSTRHSSGVVRAPRGRQ